MAIRSFRDASAEAIARGLSGKAARRALPPDLHAHAMEKLIFLDAARALNDLAAWPSLRLEKLKGDRSGQWSIRINDRFRICFVWRDGDAYDVQIVDYH